MATILNAYNLSGGDTTSSTFTSTGDCITIEATTTNINGVSSLIKIQSSDDQSIWKDIGQIIMCVGSDLYCNDPIKVTGLYVRCLLITNDSTSGNITINATEQTAGGGGTQTLEQTLVLGNTTGGEDISISNGDKIVLDNGSELRVGTYDFGGTGGISRICSVGYEDMWQSGIHHIFDNNGFIRESTNCFNYVPDISFDNTLRFKVGSRWVLDDGTTYMCTDASTGAAIWVDVSRVPSTGGTPYKLLQYDAAGDIQEVDNFTDGSGVVSIKIDARALNDSNADIIASWSSPDTFEIGATHLNLGLIQNFASNALAVAGGLNIGDVYRTAGVLMIVI